MKQEMHYQLKIPKEMVNEALQIIETSAQYFEALKTRVKNIRTWVFFL